jgi:hypothetical protein
MGIHQSLADIFPVQPINQISVVQQFPSSSLRLLNRNACSSNNRNKYYRHEDLHNPHCLRGIVHVHPTRHRIAGALYICIQRRRSPIGCGHDRASSSPAIGSTINRRRKGSSAGFSGCRHTTIPRPLPDALHRPHQVLIRVGIAEPYITLAESPESPAIEARHARIVQQ